MSQQTNKTAFPIIGIGSSAGGLEALQMFFSACPDKPNMAFVVISHLDPEHESLLAEILQAETTMPVSQATHQSIIEANHVYVIPPNFDMTIKHGALQLNPPEQPHSKRLPINTFLYSLATDQQDNAMGIIFSGTGSDGSLGLKAIYNAGGLTLAQDPLTAQYDSMPTQAINQGCVKLILPVLEMPKTLINFKKTHSLPSKNKLPTLGKDSVNQILELLHKITGKDFSQYKRTTINRRIERRMLQHKITNTSTYARYIKNNPEEASKLFQELLINVTQFFRDTGAFRVLQEKVIPTLLQDKPNGYVLRVWVAGCASGEEAYSIAIILQEYLDNFRKNITVQIFSSDLDDEIINIARAGIYSKHSCKDISQERLNHFFTPIDDGYQIIKKIRDMIVFAVQDVVTDPPFTKLDLLSCRNLMIYLQPAIQQRLISTFHYALKEKGVLFLSPSESIGNHEELFSPLNRKWKFYSAINYPTATGLSMSNIINVSSDEEEKKPIANISLNETGMSITELSRRALVDLYAPASAITDKTGNILYIHGETGRYLRPAPGQATLDIMEMAREGLNVVLQVVYHDMTNSNKTLVKREVTINENGKEFIVSLAVHRIPKSIINQNDLFLVSFTEITNKASKRKRTAKNEDLQRIDELERDLRYLKENQKINAEKQQADNEQLKSTNEELQSTNEEMQSTNEELETSKEELQSVNEELITVNSELQNKIDALNCMQNDMKNLLDNTKIGIIFLDKHLKIRSFTKEASLIYRLVATDVGRSLDDIKTIPEKGCDDLMQAAKTVLETLTPHEREFQVQPDNWFMARIQPYRTLDNFIDGVVVSFTDITHRIQPVKQALLLAENIVNTVREPLLVLDEHLTICSASRSFYQQFKVKAKDTIGHNLLHLGNHQWNIPLLRKMLHEVLANGDTFEDFEVDHDFPSIGHRKMNLNARNIVSKTDSPSLILLSIDVNK